MNLPRRRVECNGDCANGTAIGTARPSIAPAGAGLHPEWANVAQYLERLGDGASVAGSASAALRRAAGTGLPSQGASRVEGRARAAARCCRVDLDRGTIG